MSDNKLAPKVVQMPGSDDKKKHQKQSGGGSNGDKVVNPLEVGKMGQKVATELAGEAREVVSQFGSVLNTETVVAQIFGQPGAPEPKNEFQKAAEQGGQWKKKYTHERALHKETLQLVERRKRERSVQVREVRSQIQVLAKSVATWSKEVDTAVFQAPVDVSVYHESFFEKLLSFIKSMKARIDDSSHWVAMHNTRSTKKGVFWANAMKGGKLNQQYAFSKERKMGK